MTVPNLFKAFVEGLGSKKLAAVLAAIVAVFLAPVAQKYLGLDPGKTIELIGGVLAVVLPYLLAQWHIDTKSGGQTTTAYRLTLQAAGGVAAIAKDGTIVDTLAKAVVEALQKGAASEPPPGAAPAALTAVPVPQTPPSP